MSHRSLGQVMKGVPKQKPDVNGPVLNSHLATRPRQDVNFSNDQEAKPTEIVRSDSPEGSSFRLLKPDPEGQGLWYQAWQDVNIEMDKMLPPDLEPVETLDTQAQVQKVAEAAQGRADEAHQSERKMPHTKMTYRQLYGKVAKCANKFQIVGDMVTQAEPVYAALPWALIRFAIQCAVGEDEAYHTMLTGTDLVSDLVSQYPALEQLYAQIDSPLSKKFRKSLVNFYKTILQYQIFAINYFDPHSKAKRAILGFNPVTAADIKDRRKAIDESKLVVDHDAALVSSEVIKLGVDNLKASQEDQDKQLSAIQDGIRALAGETGQAIRNLSREQQIRNNTLAAMWKGPMDNMLKRLESHEIEQAREHLYRVRKWLSVAKPQDDLLAAQEKRQMALGDWLLRHQKFQDWQNTNESSMLWLYGFAGTGKTGLMCRVIKHLESRTEKSDRLAFFFCSNDSSVNPGEEAFSRSDPSGKLAYSITF